MKSCVKKVLKFQSIPIYTKLDLKLWVNEIIFAWLSK